MKLGLEAVFVFICGRGIIQTLFSRLIWLYLARRTRVGRRTVRAVISYTRLCYGRLRRAANHRYHGAKLAVVDRKLMLLIPFVGP